MQRQHLWRSWAALIAALLLGAPSAAHAQAAGAPPPEPVSVDPALIRGALSARLNCQSLVRLLNEVGGHWQQLSDGSLKREQFAELRREARVEWDIRWGACAGARRDLTQGLPKSMLNEEVSQLKKLWAALMEVGALVEGNAEATEINSSIMRYSELLQDWSNQLPARSNFWSSPPPDAKELAENCVLRSEEAQRNLANALMQSAASERSLSTDESIDALRLRLEQADSLHRECQHQSPRQHIELQLLGRLMRAYRQLFDGFIEGDDQAIRESMLTAQEATSHLSRCRNEHDSGAAVSPSCTAQ